MKLERADTQRAYQQVRERIITLELAPGSLIDPGSLADQLDMSLVAVEQALNLLIHDKLIRVSPQHALYVTEVNLPDLEQISEIRLLLEGYSAQQAAQRATPDDLVVLEALQREQAQTPPAESRRLFDVDHKFHQAIARASHNRYLGDTLEQYFGLSLRLWYLVLPHLDFLPPAVGQHLELVEAIKAGDGERAETIMRAHIQDFYDRVRAVITQLPK